MKELKVDILGRARSRMHSLKGPELRCNLAEVTFNQIMFLS